MRRDAKADVNQPELVDALRAVGATVQPLHTVGQGCPDLLVGYQGKNYLLEVKQLTGKKNPRPKPLTDEQILWQHYWAGAKVRVVSTVPEALAAIGARVVAA